MSWNNVLPWWVWDVEWEQYLARCSCAFKEEWFSGTSKMLPDYVESIIREGYYDVSED